MGGDRLWAQETGVVAAQQGSSGSEHSVPPAQERDVAPSRRIAVRGFRVQGVEEHADAGITPATMQALADQRFKQLSAGAEHAELDFAQLQQVADKLTERYRSGGFIAARAMLPAQTVGADQLVVIQVQEGKIGKVVVKGATRYRPGIIAAPAQRLQGQSLRKREVDRAVLYARDLPGVAVTSTLLPGEHAGETDLIMVAREEPRPYAISLGANNYGTEVTGRYRAQLGLAWNNPLGIGDTFNGSIDYAFAPSQSVFGALSYRAPTVVVPGLSAVIGASRSQLQVDNGQFAALHIKGPTSNWYGGADWKFINGSELQMLGTLRLIREQSRLSSRALPMSDERFDLAELGFSMNRTDTRLHGIDLLQLTVRQSINDRSPPQADLVSPGHDRSFLVGKLAYTRLQFLSRTQRLYFKFAGQYTRDALTPMEQFVLGGPDTVRAYPIADVLSDRGYYTALEYHVDAPGFADQVSPWFGRPWRELLELEAFVDYARGFPVGGNRRSGGRMREASGVGAGFLFRLPQFHRLELHVDAAKSISSLHASDGKGYHVYARVGLTF